MLKPKPKQRKRPAGTTPLGVPKDVPGPVARRIRRMLSVQAGRTGPNTDFVTGEFDSEQRRAKERAIRRGHNAATEKPTIADLVGMGGRGRDPFEKDD